jgi:hypothetical protein
MANYYIIPANQVSNFTGTFSDPPMIISPVLLADGTYCLPENCISYFSELSALTLEDQSQVPFINYDLNNQAYNVLTGELLDGSGRAVLS